MTDLQTPPWLQQGYQGGTSPDSTAQATPAAPASDPSAPPWLQPGYQAAPDAAQPQPSNIPASQSGMSEASKYLNNINTGIQASGPALLSLPNAMGRAIDWLGSKFGASDDPGFLTRHTYDFDTINKGLYDLNNATVNRPLGLPDAQPYVAETPQGRFGQSVLTGAPLALAGPGGVGAAITRQMANVAGVGGTDSAAALFPNSPGVQVGTGILASLLTGAVPPVAGAVGRTAANIGGKVLNTQNAIDKAATNAIVSGSNATPAELINRIDQNSPDWTFQNNIPGAAPNSVQPAPTLANVTNDPGIISMTYRDATSADNQKNPVYRVNASQTNTAQREAIANMTQDVGPQVQAAQDNLNSQVAALPQGLTAQDTGSTFRQGLQNVYDDRLANQRAVGSTMYDPLTNSTAQIPLRPIMDYVRSQAFSNPGDVGMTYRRILQQFTTPSGITLDTPQFSQGVMKSLGDLAQSYPVGSSSNRAVLTVKDMLDNHINQFEPAIGDARAAYAQASRPLDIFDSSISPGPIANAVQTTRFGGYTTDNNSVVSQFLTSKGGPDAITNLTQIFPDAKSGTQALQDYIASQVQSGALNPDGSVNATKLASVTKPFSAVLDQPAFSGLKQQFSDLGSAQTAVDQITARQKLLDTFQNGLGLETRDMNGVQNYGPKKFNDFVTANQGQLVSAYGQAGATRINQIAKQLQAMAQNGKQAGTSGTAQLLNTGADNVLGALWKQAASEAGGDIFGAVTSGAAGALGFGAGGKLLGLATMGRLKKFDSRVNDAITTALTDPASAKALLQKYDPSKVVPVGKRAMDYVKNQISAIGASQLSSR